MPGLWKLLHGDQPTNRSGGAAGGPWTCESRIHLTLNFNRAGLTMNAKQLVVGIVWLGFAALTVAIFAVEGSTALAIPYPRLASIGVTVDLFIALALVSIWMYFDARKRGEICDPFHSHGSRVWKPGTADLPFPTTRRL